MEISLNPADHPNGCLGWSCPTCPFAAKMNSKDCQEMRLKAYYPAQKPKEDEENLTTIRVSVPVTFNVDYLIKVKDPKDPDEIHEKMSDLNASAWENDPQFYERLGDDWNIHIQNITRESINTVESNQLNLCDSCREKLPECPAQVKNVVYGTGLGKDNIISCQKYQKEFSETCQFCKKTFQCSHPNTAYSIRAAHENNCLENPKNKRPEDRFKKTTCVNCNNFKLIFGLPDGICLKGHGYTDKTAQGLPVPKKGTGYVTYFNPTCTEDFEKIKEINYETK